MQALGLERLGAPNVVDIVGVAAVNDDVARLEAARQIVHGLLDHGGGNHHPRNPRLGEFGGKVVERGCAGRALGGQLRYRLGANVEDHALMPAAQQTPHHVGAHPAQSDHSYLHLSAPCRDMRIAIANGYCTGS